MHTFIIAAVTADGFIGKDSAHRSFNWTTQEDKNFYIEKIKEARVCVVGSNSFKPMQKFPRDMHYVVYTRSPDKFVNHRPDVITAEPTMEDPKALIERLSKKYQQVAICGGSTIYTQFMQAGVVDTLYLTIEPVLFGAGVRLFTDDIESQIKLKDLRRLSDQTTLLEYQVLR